MALFEQEPQFDEAKTVLENLFHSNHPIMQVIRQYEAAVDSQDGHALAEAIVQMDELGAWDFEAKVKQILGS